MCERENLGFGESQYALLVMYVFSGQMKTFYYSYITNLFQPLDVAINGSVKALMKQIFALWCESMVVGCWQSCDF